MLGFLRVDLFPVIVLGLSLVVVDCHGIVATLLNLFEAATACFVAAAWCLTLFGATVHCCRLFEDVATCLKGVVACVDYFVGVVSLLGTATTCFGLLESAAACVD